MTVDHRNPGRLPRRRVVSAAAIAGVTLLMATPATAQSGEVQTEPRQGPRRSPDDVSYLRARSDEPGEGLFETGLFTLLVPRWYDYKQDIEDATGLDFGLAYTGLYQKATDSVAGPDQAGGGDFDFFGEWNLVGDDPGEKGLLGFLFEQRHAYGATPPSQLGTSIGSMWPTTRGYDEHEPALPQVYWDQHLADDAVQIRVGKYDHNNVWDTYTFRSENFFFQNLMFSGNASFNPPTAIGAKVSWRPTDEVYVMAGLADANGRRDTFDLSSFFEDREYYHIGEIGFSPRFGAYEAAYFHATFWRVDARQDAGTSAGSGVAVTAQYSAEDVIPFLRYAISDADAGTVFAQQNVNAGLGLMRPFDRADDALVFGIGGGEEVGGPRWQVVTEVFYRLQLTPYVQVTPSIQGIFHPIDHPTEDALGVFGIRFRITL